MKRLFRYYLQKEYENKTVNILKMKEYENTYQVKIEEDNICINFYIDPNLKKHNDLFFVLLKNLKDNIKIAYFKKFKKRVN